MTEAELQRLALDDGSEEEEEEDEELPVMLGFVRVAKDPHSLQRQHFPHKAGGAPAWLDPLNLPRMDDACCAFCKEPLQFLLQIYAPIDDKRDAFHRTLFVFMCVNMSCLKKDQLEQKIRGSRRSVKVFRAQLPRENKFYSSTAPDSPLTPGVTLCDWCTTWKGEKLCGGCRKINYCSRKHQVEHWHADHLSSCKTSESTSMLTSKKLWPEFEMYTSDEAAHEDAENETQNSLQILPTKEDTLSKELQDFEEASKEEKCWVAFEERMQRAPGQILRYCREKGAKPLWTRLEGQPEPDDIAQCSRCGGARSYEFQVLPQLLFYFRVENEVDSLDWGTIAIYSCSDSCPVEGYAEEFAWVQLSS